MNLTKTVMHALVVFATGSVLLLGGCSGEDKNAPDPNAACVPAADGTLRGIGPAGGEIVYSEPGHASDGLTVRVAPGAWEECWEVRIDRWGASSSPSYPKGFLPFESPAASGHFLIFISGGFDSRGNWREVPEIKPMELLFPRHTIEPGDSEILAVFLWDDAQNDWTVHPPATLDERFLTINVTGQVSRYSWGRIHLGSVDFDKYLAPVVETMHGTENWQSIDRQVDQIIAELGPLRFDCITLRALRNYFSELEPRSYAALHEIQNRIRCGACDATTPEFYAELNKFVNLHFYSMMMDLIFGNSRVFALQLYAVFYSMHSDHQLRQLQCDFECFSRSVDATFYLHLSANYLSRSIVAIIDELLEFGIIRCNMG